MARTSATSRTTAPSYVRAARPAGPPAARPAASGDLRELLAGMRERIERTVRDGGARGLRSLVRSQGLIRPVHEHLARALADRGVPPSWVRQEHALPTRVLPLRQDVVVAPTRERAIVSVGVKSSVSSGSKNTRNLYNSIRAETHDLHEHRPDLVAGHLFIQAIGQVAAADAVDRRVRYVRMTPGAVRDVTLYFTRLNGRREVTDAPAYLERAGLVLVDFSAPEPLVYESLDELVADGWLTARHAVADLSGTRFDGFVDDLLARASARFPEIAAPH